MINASEAVMIIGSVTQYSYTGSYWSIKQDEPASTEEVAPVVTQPEEIAEEQDKEKKNADKLRGENGVLRLLEEGHFKPNADMRLREIFHRELSILEAQNQPPMEPESAPELNVELLPQDEIETEMD